MIKSLLLGMTGTRLVRRTFWLNCNQNIKILNTDVMERPALCMDSRQGYHRKNICLCFENFGGGRTGGGWEFDTRRLGLCHTRRYGIGARRA